MENNTENQPAEQAPETTRAPSSTLNANSSHRKKRSRFGKNQFVITISVVFLITLIAMGTMFNFLPLVITFICLLVSLFFFLVYKDSKFKNKNKNKSGEKLLLGISIVFLLIALAILFFFFIPFSDFSVISWMRKTIEASGKSILTCLGGIAVLILLFLGHKKAKKYKLKHMSKKWVLLFCSVVILAAILFFGVPVWKKWIGKQKKVVQVVDQNIFPVSDSLFKKQEDMHDQRIDAQTEFLRHSHDSIATALFAEQIANDKLRAYTGQLLRKNDLLQKSNDSLLLQDSASKTIIIQKDQELKEKDSRLHALESENSLKTKNIDSLVKNEQMLNENLAETKANLASIQRENANLKQRLSSGSILAMVNISDWKTWAGIIFIFGFIIGLIFVFERYIKWGTGTILVRWSYKIFFTIVCLTVIFAALYWSGLMPTVPVSDEGLMSENQMLKDSLVKVNEENGTLQSKLAEKPEVEKETVIDSSGTEKMRQQRDSLAKLVVALRKKASTSQVVENRGRSDRGVARYNSPPNTGTGRMRGYTPPPGVGSSKSRFKN